MADRYAMSAAGALNPVYTQAQQQLNQQVPQTQALYDTLLGGLQQTGEQATVDIVQDAARRGLNRPTLQADTQMAMDEAIMQAAAQIRRKKAEEDAALLEARGQLAIGKVQNINSLAENVQSASQVESKAKMAAQEAQRDYDFKNLQLTRQDQLSRRSAARSASKDAASLSSAQNSMYEKLLQEAGSDGHVSPKVWNFRRKQWKENGLPLRKFDKTFSKQFVNTVHQEKDNAKLGRYAGQAVTKRGR